MKNWSYTRHKPVKQETINSVRDKHKSEDNNMICIIPRHLILICYVTMTTGLSTSGMSCYQDN